MATMKTDPTVATCIPLPNCLMLYCEVSLGTPAAVASSAKTGKPLAAASSKGRSHRRSDGAQNKDPECRSVGIEPELELWDGRFAGFCVRSHTQSLRALAVKREKRARYTSKYWRCFDVRNWHGCFGYAYVPNCPAATCSGRWPCT